MHEAQAVENAVEKSVSQSGKIVDKIKRVLVPTRIDPKALATKFEGYMIIEGKSVHLDYRHLFTIEEVIEIKSAGNFGKPKITGWHHDYADTLKKMGTIAYENVTLLENGAYEAVPIINGVMYNKKTFFPAHWTEEIVVEKILDVFKKCYENKNYKVDWTGSYIMTDFTNCGVEIKLIYDPKERLITTAYPIVKKIL